MFTPARLVVVGAVAWVYSGAHRGRLVHSCSRGFARARLRVVGSFGFGVRLLIIGFILVRFGLLMRAFVSSGSRFRVDSLERTYGSSGLSGDAWVHSGALRFT